MFYKNLLNDTEGKINLYMEVHEYRNIKLIIRGLQLFFPINGTLTRDIKCAC